MMKTSVRVMACAPAFGAPGGVAQNKDAILQRVQEAKSQGAQVLVLPELCLSGGGLGSLYASKLLLGACESAAKDIARACEGLLCVFGLPLEVIDGTANALAVVKDGELVQFVIKSHLKPFEKPYFISTCPESILWQGQDIPCGGLFKTALGEHSVTATFWDDILAIYPDTQPFDADLICASALEPAKAGWLERQTDWIASLNMNGAALAYANAGTSESTTDQVYPGEACLVQHSQMLGTAPAFKNAVAMAEIGGKIEHGNWLQDKSQAMDPEMPYAPLNAIERASWCHEAIEIAAQGLAARMKRINAKTATLGVSGGLDSAMALVTTCRAFDILGLHHTGIYAYSLPGLGSSARTKNNALKLMEAFGLPPREVDLKASILQHFEDIDQDINKHDAAYENAQARERTQFLMDMANRVGGLMVGSGDLSELALGFTTFGGDHMSMYGVNAGLYKSAIRLILRQVALDSPSDLLKTTLLDILDTPISPELLPGDGDIKQKTEDIVGPYELNDFFLHWFLSAQATPKQLLDMTRAVFKDRYSHDEIIHRMGQFFRRFFQNQFKRNCLPDGPMVLGVSLSPRGGFTLPSDASAALWVSEIDRLKGNKQA